MLEQPNYGAILIKVLKSDVEELDNGEDTFDKQGLTETDGNRKEG